MKNKTASACPIATRGRQQHVTWLRTLAGLVIGFVWPWFVLPRILQSFPRLSRELRLTSPGVLGLVDRGQMLVGLILVVKVWERLTFGSVGLCKPNRIDFLQGMLLYLAIVILNQLKIYSLLTHDRTLISARLRVLGAIPLAIQIPSAVLSGISEELVARGYAIERLTALSGSVVFAAAIGTALDVASHIPFWGLWYAIAITPGEALLACIYARNRRLLPCVIAHVLLDLVPILTLRTY